MVNINKFNKYLIFLLILLFITIPISFAEDNLTSEAFVTDEDILQISDDMNVTGSGNNEILKANDVYFDASAVSDGSGTQNSPYKTISSSKLGSVNHFAPGTYTVSSSLSSFSLSSSEMSFIGNDRDTTVIRFTGSDNFLSTSSSITFSGITLYGANIVSTGGTVTATNAIFDSGVAKYEVEADHNTHGNSYGGAIKQSLSSSSTIDWSSIFGGSVSDPGMTFDNCIFKNNYAAYGGAIYAEKGTVTITNSKFKIIMRTMAEEQ